MAGKFATAGVFDAQQLVACQGRGTVGVAEREYPAGADGAIYGVKNYALYYIKHTSQATCGTSFSHIGMQPIHHGSWLKLAKPFMGNEKDMYFVATEAGNVPDSRGAL